MAETQGFSHPWILAEMFLVGAGNNAKTPLYHLIITAALIGQRLSMKGILSH